MDEQRPLLAKYGNCTMLKFLGGWLACCTFMCLSISLATYLIFLSNQNWYKNSIQTTCTVTSHDIIKQSCTAGENSYICYDGIVYYYYYVDTQKYNDNDIVVYHEDLLTTQNTISGYPNNSSQICWYGKKDHASSTLISEEDHQEYTTSIVFLVIGIIIFIITSLCLGSYYYINR